MSNPTKAPRPIEFYQTLLETVAKDKEVSMDRYAYDCGTPACICGHAALIDGRLAHLLQKSEEGFFSAWFHQYEIDVFGEHGELLVHTGGWPYELLEGPERWRDHENLLASIALASFVNSAFGFKLELPKEVLEFAVKEGLDPFDQYEIILQS